ncbi:MAG: FAD-dependent oxidoreductase [Candidatus Bathyarchaeia archaeon]|nr:NAD(P)/FAD-dependent oxidoreductase [Candidatus Bathyarchaeota archaeon]
MRYVIIGGSAGGIGACEAIREVDPVGEIILISEEPFPQYSRPMISEFLSGKASFEKMKYRGDVFWKENNVELKAGRKAVHLDLKERCVELDNGEKVKFDRLLIATGGKPIIPKTEGIDKRGVFTFTTISDAEKLLAVVKKNQRAVVIGGGLIGVSVAEALVERGVVVTIVELKDRILSLILDEVASRIIRDAMEDSGVTIITGQTVKSITGKYEDNTAVEGVVLSNGEEIPCGLVIFAIGVIPRTELVLGTDIKTNRGIIVDRYMRTNVSDVYACGDVAEVYDFIFGENRVLPLWPTAHLGGRVAGYNMAGKKALFPGGTAMSALNYFRVPVISVGLVNPTNNNEYEVMIQHDSVRKIYRKVVLRHNVIVGFLLVNDIERAGTLFYLMHNFVDVKELGSQLISDDFSLASLPFDIRRNLFMEGTRWMVLPN